MRNLFALIQGIRDAQAEGWEEAEDYEMDEGEYEEDADVAEDPQEEQEDYDENYEGWDEEPEETPKPKRPRKAAKNISEDKPSPRSSKKTKLGKFARLRSLARSKTWASSEAATPKPKLPRANTDESYVDPATASKEQQLAELMDQIESLQVNE